MVGSGENQNLVHTVLKMFPPLYLSSHPIYKSALDYNGLQILLYSSIYNHLKKICFKKLFCAFWNIFPFFPFYIRSIVIYILGMYCVLTVTYSILSIKLGGWVTISIWEAKGDDAGNACWCISNISLYFIVRFPILLETFQLKIQSFWTVNYVLHFSVIFSVFTVEKAWTYKEKLFITKN